MKRSTKLFGKRYRRGWYIEEDTTKKVNDRFNSDDFRYRALGALAVCELLNIDPEMLEELGLYLLAGGIDL